MTDRIEIDLPPEMVAEIDNLAARREVSREQVIALLIDIDAGLEVARAINKALKRSRATRRGTPPAQQTAPQDPDPARR